MTNTNESPSSFKGSSRQERKRSLGTNRNATSVTPINAPKDTSIDVESKTTKYQEMIKGKKETVSNTHITLDGTVLTYFSSNNKEEFIFYGATIENRSIESIVKISELNERRYENINYLDTSDIDGDIAENKTNTDHVLCYLLDGKLYAFDGQRRIKSCLKNNASLRVAFTKVNPFRTPSLKSLIREKSRISNQTQKTGFLSKIKNLKRNFTELGINYTDITRVELKKVYETHFKRDFSSFDHFRVARDMIGKFDESFVLFFGNENIITPNFLKEIRHKLKTAEELHFSDEESPHYGVNLFSQEGTKHIVDYYYCNDAADLNFLEFISSEYAIQSPLELDNENAKKLAFNKFLDKVLFKKKKDAGAKKELFDGLVVLSSKDIDKSYSLTIKDASSIPFDEVEKAIQSLITKYQK
tara:strand:- start:1419 stop:2660 length:1242 start_codon:yes stop_codon:yes gene_type:complete